MAEKVLLRRINPTTWNTDGADEVADLLSQINLRDIRACPFCKSYKSEVVHDQLYYVFCAGCGAMGPEHPDLLAALMAWQGVTEEETKP